MEPFHGKVVAITGAGGGLGRAYALAFAREGARVVVNDRGGARDGTGAGSSAMADGVVGEIRAAGGEAVASYASVATAAGAEEIVATTLGAFGRLDVLVNNAGILRDRALVEIAADEWTEVLAVHLDGTFWCTRQAALQMIDQGEGGRIINTTSLAGMIGNVGQASYASAKAGIVGLTRAAALELGPFGITVNAVAPLAKTRLTEGIASIGAEVTPADVAPMVLYLASDLGRNVTGRVFGVHGRHIFEYRTEMTRGIERPAGHWEPDEIARRLAAIGESEAERHKAAARRLAPSPAPSAASERGLRVLAAMCTALRPKRVQGWEATLHFAIAGAGEYTLVVADGTAHAALGHVGEPTCVIQMGADTFFGMATGTIDGTQAFMQGKIAASNLGDLMKYGGAFHPRKAQAAVAQALADLAAAARPSAATEPG